MLQEIAPKQYHVEYAVQEPPENGRCFVFQGQDILESFRNGMLYLPTYEELRPYADRCIYLFRIDEEEYYLCGLKGEDIPKGFGWWNLRTNRRMKTLALHFAETTAYHLFVWYRDNQVCGRCGAPTKPDRKERMLRCPKCGNLIYPKIAPAILVAVTYEDKLLMTRYQGRPYKGYALIAGFNEIGETAEDTIRREVMEEVGLLVKDIRYYGSQPWGMDSNLLLGFYARLDGSPEIHLDRQELEQAEWHAREDIDLEPDGYSLTNDMIQAFIRGEWT